MIVYRVERDDGNGPYRIAKEHPGGLVTLTSFKDVIHPAGVDPARHPVNAWVTMEVITQGSPWIFGFRTLADLRRWFNAEERARLAALGFGISAYSVPNHERWVDIDVGQLAFHRKHATRWKRMELKWPKHAQQHRDMLEVIECPKN